MEMFREYYVNPFTDFGFKKLFGEEPNKDLLMDFLNAMNRERLKALVFFKMNIWEIRASTAKPFSTYTAKTNGARNLLSNCKRPNRTSSKTVLFIMRHSPSGNRATGAIGITS
jgi:hypothetical protein